MSWRAAGLKSWLTQRLSAVYMLLFLCYLLTRLIVAPPRDYDTWRAWLTQPGVSIATLAFFGALLVHTWVGLRDVIIDYVRDDSVRWVLLVVLGTVLSGLGLWVLRILF